MNAPARSAAVRRRRDERSRRTHGLLLALAAAILATLVLGVSLASATAPTVTVEPASAVSYRTAQVEGSVDPGGETVTYRFQYVTEALFQANLTNGVPGFEGATTGIEGTLEGSGPQPVSGELAGLTQNTTYHLRLLVENAAAESGEAIASTTFTTKEVGAPTIVATSATEVFASSVVLDAEIDPGGAATTFHFEYATNDAMTGAASTPESGIESDNSQHRVSTSVNGLTPSTTYFYRAVASNEHSGAGGSPGPTLQFRTQESAASSALPDDRAYELVSPSDKNGADILGPARVSLCELVGPTICNGVSGGGVAQAAPDGGAITYLSNGSFAGALAAEPGNQYISTRSATGWSTRSLSHPVVSASTFIGCPGAPFRAFSPDLSTAVLQTTCNPPDANPPLASTAPAGYQNVYLRMADGTYRSVLNSVPPGAPPASGFKLTYEGASADLRHSVVDASLPLGEGASEADLYEYGPSGLHPIDPGLTHGNLGFEFGAIANTLHAISSDGSRVFFTATVEEEGDPEFKELFLRENAEQPQSPLDSEGNCTVSSDACTVPISRNSSFLAASLDGSRMFYLQTVPVGEGLVGHDLRSYDVATKVSTDLTPGHEAQGIMAASEDASRVYFVAGEKLTGEEANPGGEVAQVGADNLYLAEVGHSPRFIAVLSPMDSTESDSGIAADWAGGPAIRTTRATPDGRYLAFMSLRSLTGYDNTVAGSGSCGVSATGGPLPAACQEVFLYDASSNQITCASCNPSGARPTGPSLIAPATATGGSAVPFGGDYESHLLSDDGSRVFFESLDALVPRDTNGQMDVYEHESDGSGSCADAAGCTNLISSGKGEEYAQFLDATPDGSDVFFITRSRLVPQDQDQLMDVYDAREGGGLPEPPTPPAPCSGDGCQGAPAPPPALPSAASSSFSGPGNAKAKKCAEGKVRKDAKCVKKSPPREQQKKKKQKKGDRKHRSNSDQGGSK